MSSSPDAAEAAPLPDDVATLKALLLAERATAAKLAGQNEHLRAIVKELQRALFGRRSEKAAHPDQLQLALEDIEQAMAEGEAEAEQGRPGAASVARPTASCQSRRSAQAPAARRDRHRARRPDLSLLWQRAAPGARIAEAIRYALKLWSGLRPFLDNGRIEIDTNVVERAIRPIALNRKNALFAGSDQGGVHWGVIASLIETCKLNAVDPQAYLADVLSRLLNRHPASQIDQLMPWAYTQPTWPENTAYDRTEVIRLHRGPIRQHLESSLSRAASDQSRAS